MVEPGDLVVSRNGEWGWVEKFTRPLADEWVVWLRMPFGNLQTFGADKVRRFNPDDWEEASIAAELEAERADRFRIAAE